MIHELKVIYAVEIDRISKIVDKRTLRPDEVRKLADLTRGYKDLSQIVEKKPPDKLAMSASIDELTEIARGGSS